MKSKALAVATVLGSALLVSTVAQAKTHQPSCTQIQQALKSGKSEDQVVKEMKVPLSRVKSCSHTTQK